MTDWIRKEREKQEQERKREEMKQRALEELKRLGKHGPLRQEQPLPHARISDRWKEEKE